MNGDLKADLLSMEKISYRSSLKNANFPRLICKSGYYAGQKTKNKVCKCQGLLEAMIEMAYLKLLYSAWFKFEERDFAKRSVTSVKPSDLQLQGL